jgi:hypothetical protein
VSSIGLHRAQSEFGVGPAAFSLATMEGHYPQNDCPRVWPSPSGPYTLLSIMPVDQVELLPQAAIIGF